MASFAGILKLGVVVVEMATQPVVGVVEMAIQPVVGVEEVGGAGQVQTLVNPSPMNQLQGFTPLTQIVVRPGTVVSWV